MYKKSASVGSIAFKSLGIYFEKLPLFLKYLVVPVLLQILGGVVIGLGMFFIAKADYVPAIILTAAGIIILCNAIWKYLIKMGGLILISRQIVENEPLREIEYYTKTFENRGGYVLFLLITGLLIPLIPLSILIIGGVQSFISGDKSLLIKSVILFTGILALMAPYLIVTMQSFALNPNLSPWESIVKAIKLSGKNYFTSWGVIILYTVISAVVMLLVAIFAKMICVGAGLPKNVDSIIANICSQFFIPYWALCFTWWYLRMEKDYRTYTGR